LEPKDQIVEFRKRKINFTAIQINKNTNKMFDILKESYNDEEF